MTQKFLDASTKAQTFSLLQFTDSASLTSRIALAGMTLELPADVLRALHKFLNRLYVEECGGEDEFLRVLSKDCRHADKKRNALERADYFWENFTRQPRRQNFWACPSAHSNVGKRAENLSLMKLVTLLQSAGENWCQNIRANSSSESASSTILPKYMNTRN